MSQRAQVKPQPLSHERPGGYEEYTRDSEDNERHAENLRILPSRELSWQSTRSRRCEEKVMGRADSLIVSRRTRLLYNCNISASPRSVTLYSIAYLVLIIIRSEGRERRRL